MSKQISKRITISSLIISLVLIQKYQTSTKVSFYIDRTYTPEKKDYLSLFIKNDSKAILYELPTLRNKEVFELRICQKGTIQKIKEIPKSDEQKNLIENKLNENCLYDSFNTISVVDFGLENLVEQVPIYNIYKVCNFGFQFPEAERSFLYLSNNQMRFIKNISESDRKKNDLFYYGMDQIMNINDKIMDKDYRKTLQKDEKNRCEMDFEENFDGFEYEKFEEKSDFYKGLNSKSDFIIEYDFGDDFEFKNPENTEYQNEEANADLVVKSRDKMLTKMESKYVFQKKTFQKLL